MADFDPVKKPDGQAPSDQCSAPTATAPQPPAPSAPPAGAVLMQGPYGGMMVGTPVVPERAYPAQSMPAPYLMSPPTAFYDEAAKPRDGAPPFYYGAPQGYQQPAYAPPPPPCAPAGQPMQQQQGSYNPNMEITADFSNAEWKATDRTYTGDCKSVTHLNYYSNYLKSLSHLDRFPSLLRLTVRENELRTLKGIHAAPYLRWIDASANYLKDFTGMGTTTALEWLDAHQNDIKSVHGLTFAPNLSWLNLHHNYLSTFEGVQALPNLRYIDASDNELKSARGLERCPLLQEINLASNHLTDAQSIMDLANLPHLFRINIYWNDLSDPDEAAIVQHFQRVKPQCEVITTAEHSRRVGHNVTFQGTDVAPQATQSCCTIA